MMWVIRDVITGKGIHKCELIFHLMPMNLKKNDLSIETKTIGTNIVISPEKSDNLKLTIKQGFISESYGKRVKAPILIYSKKGKLPMEFKTLIKVKQ